MENEINARIKSCFNAILGYVPNYSLVFINDRKKKWAGQATYHKNILEFNLAYHSIDPDYFMGEIVGHEVAHLITSILYPDAKQHHGPEFRKIMSRLGLLGKTYIPDHMTIQEKFLYRCGCGKDLFYPLKSHLKIKMMKSPVCRKCGDSVVCVSN